MTSYPGLKNILSMISTEPNSSKLINCYITLLQDLPKLAKKSALLDLSRMLIRENPHQSLIISQNIVQTDPHNVEALNIMKSALSIIGKTTRAHAIDKEIEAIQSKKSLFQNNFIEIEPNQMNHKLSQISESDPEQIKTVKTYKKILPTDHATQIIDPDKNNEYESKKKSSLTQKNQEIYKLFDLAKIKPFTNLIMFIQKNSLLNQNHASIAEQVQYLKIAGYRIIKTQNIFDANIESFHQNYLYDKAHNTKQGLIKGLARLDPKVFEKIKARVTEIQDQPKLLWSLFQSLWGYLCSLDTLQLIKENNLGDVHIGFWGMYLDSLIASGNSRKALYEIHQTLIKNPDIVWAQTSWDRLPFIWDRLKLRGINWEPEDGIEPLMKALSSRRAQKYIGLIAEQPFRKQFPKNKAA